MKQSNEIQYEGELTGTVNKAVEQPTEEEGDGLLASPIQQMWQVNPGAEAVDPKDAIER